MDACIHIHIYFVHAHATAHTRTLTLKTYAYLSNLTSMYTYKYTHTHTCRKTGTHAHTLAISAGKHNMHNLILNISMLLQCKSPKGRISMYFAFVVSGFWNLGCLGSRTQCTANPWPKPIRTKALNRKPWTLSLASGQHWAVNLRKIRGQNTQPRTMLLEGVGHGHACICKALTVTPGRVGISGWEGFCTHPTWRFRGSYKWGHKSLNMGYKYSYPT